MADSVGKIVLDVLNNDCGHITCAYRAGDSQKSRNNFVELINKKLKHRVADGNEVRLLEQRVKVLEHTLRNLLAQASSRRDKNAVDTIRVALAATGKKKL